MKGRYRLSPILQMGKLRHRVKVVEPELRSSLFFAISKPVFLTPLVPCGLNARAGACVLSILCPYFPKGSKGRKLRSHLSSTKGSRVSCSVPQYILGRTNGLLLVLLTHPLALPCTSLSPPTQPPNYLAQPRDPQMFTSTGRVSG